jgi:pimeloyl-ACP methyl ester carboxylesterase
MVAAAGFASVCFVVGCTEKPLPEEKDPPPGEIIETEVKAGEYTFTGRKAGPPDGDVVFLLHGFPETSYEWRTQLKALGEAGYFVFAPDQRGYSAGARPDDIDSYKVELLVKDVLAMADELGVKKFHLVGHDWGAGVAWAVASSAPERLLSLTSLSIPHIAAFNAQLDDMESCQYKASYYFDLFTAPGSENQLLANDAALMKTVYEGLPDDVIETYLDALGKPEVLGLGLNWYRANVKDRHFIGSTIGKITTPTLFVWGDEDPAVCGEGAMDTANFVTGPYQFETLNGVGHWIPETASDDVNKLLIKHLAENTP